MGKRVGRGISPSARAAQAASVSGTINMAISVSTKDTPSRPRSASHRSRRLAVLLEAPTAHPTAMGPVAAPVHARLQRRRLQRRLRSRQTIALAAARLTLTATTTGPGSGPGRSHRAAVVGNAVLTVPAMMDLRRFKLRNKGLCCEEHSEDATDRHAYHCAGHGRDHDEHAWLWPTECQQGALMCVF